MIYYAPVLPSEGWTSIDRYRQDYEKFFPSFFPETEVRSLLPDPSPELNIWKRRWTRDFNYPSSVSKALRQAKEASVFHVFDHSYAHLCQSETPTILHCRDLNHLVLPSLKGLALMRWKQRVQGMKKAAMILAISEQLSGEIQEHLGISSEKIRVLHHGVDLDCYQPNRLNEAVRKYPELASLAREHFLILNIGTNLSRKNLETVYSALSKLKREGIPCKLIRVGSNETEDGEESRIQSYGVAEDVVQMGILSSDEVALVCNLCHALSFASLYEGFGRPLLEAQASGLPLVAAKASCIPEVAGSGAFYHEPSSSEDLAEKLKIVWAGEEEVERVRELGFVNAARFSWQQHFSQLKGFYDELM